MSRKGRKKRSKARASRKRTSDSGSTLPTQQSQANKAHLTSNATNRSHLQFEGHLAAEFWPSVSLCMIVKNEEANLAACLESVGNFVQEIIIVDTGSTDRTVEIAQSFGAQIKHFTWIDDFAAARNESIKDAQSDWIFWMDADDRLSPENLIRLKQVVASGKADAYYCYVVSQLQAEKVGEDRIEHLRLFRNGAGVHFERPLHEDAAPVAHRLGLSIARTNIVIDHAGYAASHDVLLRKLHRNLPIIQNALDRNPDDLYWRFHLGVTLHVLGHIEESIEHLEAVMTNPPSSLERNSYLYQAHEALMLAYVETGQPEQARRALHRALPEFSNRQHFWIRAGTIYLALDEPDQAVAAFGRANSLETDIQGQSWAPGILESYLSQAYLLLGEVTKAGEAYRIMLTKTAKSNLTIPAELWDEIHALVDAQRSDDVIKLLEPMADADPFALRVLATAHAANQHWEAAARHLACAIALSEPGSGEWVKLAKYTLNAKNKALHARRYCQLALIEEPQNAGAMNLLGIIALGRHESSQALTHFVESILAEPEHQSAWHNLVNACQSMNLAPLDVIRQYGLRMMKQPSKAPNYAQAVAALKLVVMLAPQTEQAQTYKLIATALQKMGQEEDALVCWQKAQQIELECAT